MKYIIWLFFIAAIASILCGSLIEVSYSKKLVGYGILGLFFLVIPLFSWYRWKDKNPKDYMLNKENLDKMRERENRKKN
jgi:nicotinamide riboside transporter PnuC